MKQEKTESALGATAVPMGNVPMGTVVAFVLNKANIPTGWLLCDGSAIPAQYQQLITALGSSNTPNLSGRTLVATGSGTDGNGTSATLSLGQTGGEYTHVLTEQEMPSHQHFGWGEHSGSNWGTGNTNNQGYSGSHSTDTDNQLWGSTYTGGVIDPANQLSTSNGELTTTSAGSPTAAHNNVQPYYAVYYIIYTGQDS